MSTFAQNITFVERNGAHASPWRVSMREALDPDIPLDEIRRLASSDTAALRRAAAFNPAAPESILRDLCADDNPRVREAARMSLKGRGLAC